MHVNQQSQCHYTVLYVTFHGALPPDVASFPPAVLVLREDSAADVGVCARAGEPCAVCLQLAGARATDVYY